MNTFFDESGGLNIDDLILQQPSFKKIMEDGIVTEEELAEIREKLTSHQNEKQKEWGQTYNKMKEAYDRSVMQGD